MWRSLNVGQPATIPAILGALRFAKRFIFVGDEKQLPPLVLRGAARHRASPTLSSSFLKAHGEDDMKEHSQEKAACVALRSQYRMNQWISHFASRVFYNGTLLAAPSVAKRVLEIPCRSAIHCAHHHLRRTCARYRTRCNGAHCHTHYTHYTYTRSRVVNANAASPIPTLSSSMSPAKTSAIASR